MTAGHTASSSRRWGRLTVAFTLAISLVTVPAGPALAATDTYADDFLFSFSGDTGSASWTTDWIEWGEADGPLAGALTAGLEPNCPGGGANSCLIIGKGGPAEVALEREVDLSRATTATLEFTLDRHFHNGTQGTVELSVSGNGGTDWTPLETWDLSVDAGVETVSHDLAGHLSSNARIRFQQFGGASDSHINIDDLVITAENDLSVYAGGIVINEVLFDQTPGGGGEDEFVELYNATTSPVSLDGWDLQRNTGNSYYIFPAGVSLAPGEYAVIWTVTYDPGGLRDAPAAAFQDGAGEGSNFLSEGGDAIWLYDDGGFRVDFVAWGGGIGTPPPEWDATYESAIGGSATARGQSISLTPDGVDGNDSACWEPTTSGDAAGRCAGYLPTGDIDPVAQLWTPGVSNQGPPSNYPPVFDQDLLDRADSEGTLISISAGATDPDLTDTLTYTATGLPEGISLNPTTGLIAGALGPNSSGTHAVTITVTDNGIPSEQDVDTFTWTVSAGEVAYLVANTGGSNGGNDLLTAVDLTDPNPATNEINIGTGTGTTNIEAIALQPGTDTLFAVENNQLGTIDLTTGTFTALPSTVGSGNGAVGLITFDNIESLAFNPFTGYLYATHRRGDYEADVLFRIDPATGAVVSGAFGGNDYVAVQQTGGFYHVADLAFDPTDGQLHGIHWTFLGQFSVATIDPVSGAASTVGPIPNEVHGLAFDGSGGLWATTADTPSPYFLNEFDKTDASIISTATIDNGGNYEAIAISFPFEPNLPPVFDQDLLDQTNPEGTTISISAAATDPDPSDTLLYTATDLPPGLTIDPNSGLITGTISFAAAGTYPVVITTTDNGIPNLNDIDTLAWTITDLNQAPTFDQDLIDRADSEGTLISVSAGATDPDLADTLTYTATGLPEGISLNPVTGLITGAPDPNSSGTHAVTITVTDNGSPTLNDIDTFTWTVSAGEVAYLVSNTGGANGGNDQLTAVDLTDPNPATNEINIGTGTGTTNIEAIALQPGTDTLFAVENNQLGTIDLTTGTFTAFSSTVGSGNGAVGLITFDNIESLAFNPFTGYLYATHRRGTSNEDVLFRIDPATGAVIPGAFGGNDYIPIQRQGGYYHAADLAFDPTDGQLYGIHWDLVGFFSLATINPDTGATATAGAIPYGVAGLAFSDTGGLWGTTADTSSPYFLYEFDKTDASIISTATIDNGGNYEAIAISFPFEPNLPPVFDQDLLDQTNPEGTTISISAAATDPDPSDTLLYTATDLPPGLTIDPNSGLITGTISFAAAGTYPVVITATDNGIPNLNDVDTLIWTITEANQPPAFDQDLLNRSDAEGDTISLSAGATDPDPGDTLLITAVGLPTGLSIDPGSGLISGTLPFTASGTYPVTITATDNGAPNLSDVDTFTWTIANTNRPPVIVSPGAQTTPELAPFSLLITASDPDLTTPGFSDGGTLPAWATLTDNLDGTATISGTPGGGDSSTSTVTITADDGLLSDDADFDLTVTNTNLPPVIVNPGNQVGSENAAFSLLLSATDPDTTLPNFTDAGTLPGWATLTDHGDGTATIAGTPGYDDAGITSVTITASDGALTDDAVFDIDIANTNRPPTVDPIANQTVAEADTFTLTVTASDPDLTIPALTAAGLPTWAGFTDNGDGTATITGTPGYEDAATHPITITATDGTLTGTTSFTLTVTNTNRAPVMNPITDQTVAETAPFSLVVSGTDPDLTVPFLNITGLPAWASFTDNGDGTATITGTPGYEDAATHPITITATDDGPLTATEAFTLTITNTNRAPVVDPIANQTVAEADPFTLTVTASDPDLTTPALTAAGLPTWASFTDNGDGTATITGTPGYTDAGTHLITITATDDGPLSATETFRVTVTNTNRAPVVDPIANQTVAEADPFTLTVTASDPDLTTPALTAAGLPTWASFTDNGDGTATITGTPGYTDAAAHLITITADDGALTGATAFALTITNTNRAPSITNPGPQSSVEAAPFSLLLSATDPDTTLPNFTDAGTLPGWATLTDHGDGTATIAGTPGYDDAGITTVTITASDGALTDDAIFDIDITNTNRPPIVDPISDQTVAETDPFSLVVSGTDPDLTIPALTAAGLPTWAGFTDNGDGTATITGTPGYEDAATHPITITATDGTLTGTTSFTLTVTNTNRAPVMNPITDQTVAETAPFTLTVTGSDPDLTIPALTAGGLPAWATLTDNGDGTATITGTPGYEDAATHPITITATDDGPLTATETFTLTITNTNRTPEATDDAILVPDDAASIVFAVLGNDSDPDGDAISVVSFDPTTIGTVTDEGGGTFRYVPGPDAPYAEAFVYTITDPGGATATATVYVSVTVPAPLPPIAPVELPALVGLGQIFGTELAPIGFTAAITFESEVGFTLVDGPAGAVIDPATGVFSWVPTESQGPADYTFAVRITDPDGTFLDESVVAVSVGELETAPSLLPSGPFIAEPGTTFTATFRATDPDLPANSPRFELSGDRPPGAVLDPATGVLVWDITPGQPVGRTDVTIRVVDGSDPALHDEMTITVTVGAASSSQRKATLVAGLLPAQGAERSLPEARIGTESGVQRTLVIMARAGMGSAQAFGAPFLLLALLTVLVISFGRISIHPLLGRSRRQSGTVAWFDAASGYGFIIPDQAAEELFLHRSALGRGRADVAPGDRVSFRTVKGSQRSFALKVRDEAQS